MNTLKKKSFSYFLFSLFFFVGGVVCSDGAIAQIVHPAMKYQAVLRKVNGLPMTNASDINIRINIRKDSEDGVIVYSEDHHGVETNSMGVFTLNIGDGEVRTGTSLLDIAWGEAAYFVQTELEVDGSGYTQMGVSEMLSVPYAFYASNATAEVDYSHLLDKYLVSYDEKTGQLVSSSVRNAGGEVEISASRIVFEDLNKENRYVFPNTTGTAGQSLVLQDNQGNLGWSDVSELDPVFVQSASELENNRLPYWDATNRKFKNSYWTQNGNYLNFDGDKTLRIGDYTMPSSAATAPEKSVLRLNAAKDGLEFVPMTSSSSSAKELKLDNSVLQLLDDGALESSVDLLDYAGVWKLNADQAIYNNGDLTTTYVGIGTDKPLAKFHLSDGNVFFSNQGTATNPLPSLDNTDAQFVWLGEKAALRMGKVDPSKWQSDLIGLYSIGMGYHANACKEGNIALGYNVNASEEKNIVMGRDAFTMASESMAMGIGVQSLATKGVGFGINVQSAGEGALAMGIGLASDNADWTKAIGNSSIAIGRNAIAEKNTSLAIGVKNKVQGERSVALGNYLHVRNGGANSLLIGVGDFEHPENFYTEAEQTILIGTGKNVIDANSIGSVGIGSTLSVSSQYSVSLGNDINNWSGQNSICIGNNIETVTVDFAGEAICIGNNIINNEDYCMIIGNGYNDDLMGKNPRFVVASNDNGEGVLMYVDASGDMYASNFYQTSDIRLKKDIRPFSVAWGMLDSIQAFSYTYKNDRQGRKQFGFLAQEVEKYFPNLVSVDNKGMRKMNYISFIPLLWNFQQQSKVKIQEMEVQLQQQQQLIKEQSQKIEDLERKLEEITNQLDKLGL